MKSARRLAKGTAVNRNLSVFRPAEHRTEGTIVRLMTQRENTMVESTLLLYFREEISLFGTGDVTDIPWPGRYQTFGNDLLFSKRLKVLVHFMTLIPLQEPLNIELIFMRLKRLTYSNSFSVSMSCGHEWKISKTFKETDKRICTYVENALSFKKYCSPISRKPMTMQKLRPRWSTIVVILASGLIWWNLQRSLYKYTRLRQ